MAEHGIRQIGEPRIRYFADRLRPEPLHLEINSWQHVLDIIYKEALRRGRYGEFIQTLKSEKNSLGCGLKFIAMKIEEHYSKESQRFKKT